MPPKNKNYYNDDNSVATKVLLLFLDDRNRLVEMRTVSLDEAVSVLHPTMKNQQSLPLDNQEEDVV